MKTVILQKEHSYREYPLADRGTIGTKEYRIEDGILFLDCEGDPAILPDTVRRRERYIYTGGTQGL